MQAGGGMRMPWFAQSLKASRDGAAARVCERVLWNVCTTMYDVRVLRTCERWPHLFASWASHEFINILLFSFRKIYLFLCIRLTYYVLICVRKNQPDTFCVFRFLLLNVYLFLYSINIKRYSYIFRLFASHTPTKRECALFRRHTKYSWHICFKHHHSATPTAAATASSLWYVHILNSKTAHANEAPNAVPYTTATASPKLGQGHQTLAKKNAMDWCGRDRDVSASHTRSSCRRRRFFQSCCFSASFECLV